MEFLKKHYEKLLLGLVLAGLVGALVFMPFYISSDNQARAELMDTIIRNPSAKLLEPVDMTPAVQIAARLRSTYALDLETTNRLFNPMEWQRMPDGTIVPVASHVGPRMVVVTNIVPLYFVITLDNVTTNELGARYVIGVERQAEKVAAKRRKQQRYVSNGDKPNDTFSLVQVKGLPEAPDELQLKLVDGGDIVTITRDKPFRRVDGYSVDFRYDPEKRVFKSRREGDKVAFNGTEFLVDSVTSNELVLQDQTNLKKTSLPFVP